VNPTARTDDLVVTDADGDTLVYDLRTHRAHSLDPAAARLWRLCDGTRDLSALAAALDADGGADGDPEASRTEVVRYALARLARAELVRDVPAGADRPLSRRELLRRLGAAGAAAVVIPAILTVVAPTTLQAQASCLPKDFPCTPGAKTCCPGFKCQKVGGGPNAPRVCV
jgi:Coenzyme PQQ synthesis protein D (PqqD)